MKPVLNEDGTIKSFTLRLKGKPGLVRCPAGCGANVYHKPDDTDEDLYECNSCGAQFLCE